MNMHAKMSYNRIDTYKGDTMHCVIMTCFTHLMGPWHARSFLIIIIKVLPFFKQATKYYRPVVAATFNEPAEVHKKQNSGQTNCKTCSPKTRFFNKLRSRGLEIALLKITITL
jgi:hypothetical protein